MSRWRWVRAAFALLICVGLAAAGRAGAQEAAADVETGGWRAAWSGGVHERDAGRGEVAPGISIFAVRGTMEMMRLHDWANALIQQAADRAGLGGLAQDEQFQAMRFTVRTVRELIRARRSGAATLDLNGLEFKAGVLEEQRYSGRLLVPYVALRTKTEQSGGWQRQDSVPWQQAPLPSAAVPQQEPFFADPSADPLNALRLTNTARPVSSGSWEWTAFMDGPAAVLRRIRSVTYHLHSTFNPSRRQGDSTRLGHPLTAVGWGTFLLRADVELDDGTRRSYEHTLQFH